MGGVNFCCCSSGPSPEEIQQRREENIRRVLSMPRGVKSNLEEMNSFEQAFYIGDEEEGQDGFEQGEGSNDSDQVIADENKLFLKRLAEMRR
mmetsp:Transcript_12941/g.21895  ORF Transcript_12941/g.21895 Transcript_12941/m.21895 type:complete len:92 (+) Transcript_12941:26-301(+)